jgi:ubiquinone/menaquinone biosynthesis C-methylase UbiE
MADFNDSAGYWDRVYVANSVKAQVYRRRQRRVLRWIDEIARPGASVVDVGTGAGHLAVALARRGLRVVAVDSSEAMLEHTKANAAAAGVEHLVSPVACDAYQLLVPDDTFDIVVANGLLPWVDRPKIAISEMVRIARPGGHIILTMDNAHGIARFVDPGWHQFGRSVIRAVRSVLRMRAPARADQWPASHTWKEVEALLRSSNLTLLRRTGVGFGPFTFLGRAVFPRSLSMKLDRRLQALSDRSTSPLRNTGIFHLVLAQKPSKSGELQDQPPSVRPPPSRPRSGSAR